MIYKKTKRLFLAIYPPQKTLAQLAKIKKQISSDKLRWIKEKNLHITLVFLGNVNLDLIPNLIDKLNLVAKKTDKFTLTFKKTSLTPEENPNMIWAEFKNNPSFSKLNNICKKICSEFNLKNCNTETNKLRPHITLAKSKSYLDRKKILLKQYRIDSIIVGRFTLVESKLGNMGSEYTKITTFLLK